MYGANESAESEDESYPRYIRITDIDEDGKLLEEGDAGYGDEKYYIEYNEDVYYCIPEDGYTPGPTPPPVSGDSSVEISGTVMTVDFDIIDDHTLVVDVTVMISGNTLVIIEGSHDDDDDEVIDNTFVIGDETTIDDHTLSLSNSDIIENNTLII